MQNLRRALGLWDSVAIITAIVVGVGISRVPAETAKYLASPALILFAWLIGGIVSLIGALCYAELSSSLPKTGGSYVYLRESYGRAYGFLFAWTELVVIRAGSIAAVSFIAAEYIASFFSVSPYLTKPAAILIIFGLSAVNMFGLRQGKKVHNTLTIINICALTGMIVASIFSGKGNPANFSAVPAVNAPGQGILPLLGLALVPILWTYGGWHENTFVAEETKDPAKTLPAALIMAALIVSALYVAANAAYIYLMPLAEISKTDLIGGHAFQILFGPAGRKAFEAIAIGASLGTINAMIITGSRVTLAMANDNPVFGYLAKIDERYASPRRAIALNAVWSSVLIAIGTFNRLLFFTGILVWLFFALSAGGIFILRRKFPEMKRPYKVWGYPITPILFIFICAGIFVNTIIFNPVPSVVGLFLMATGIPVYVLSRRLGRQSS